MVQHKINSKNMKKLFLPIVFFILSGCYYDSEEAMYGKPGSGTCDTSVAKYSTQVQPILSSYCLTCHSNAAASGSGGGIKLQNYADVKIYVDNGKLKASIEHTSNYPMPKGGGSLSSCDISIINAWITKGALND